jgi:hypothetical protein
LRNVWLNDRRRMWCSRETSFEDPDGAVSIGCGRQRFLSSGAYTCTQRQIKLGSTSTPRSAKSLETCSYARGHRRYQQTHSTITSPGKWRPLNGFVGLIAHQLLPYQTSIPKFAMEPCRVPRTIPDHSFFPLGSDAVSVAIFWRRAGEAARKGHRRFPQDQPSCTRSPSSGVWAFSPSCNPAFHSKCGPARRITSGTATS